MTTTSSAVPDAAVEAAVIVLRSRVNVSKEWADAVIRSALPYLVDERNAFWRCAAKEGQEHVARMVAIIAEKDAEIARVSANHMAAERLVAEGDREINEKAAEIEALKHDLALVMDAASEQATLATDLLAKLSERDAEVESLLEEVKAHRADNDPLLKAANEGAARIKALEEALGKERQRFVMMLKGMCITGDLDPFFNGYNTALKKAWNAIQVEAAHGADPMTDDTEAREAFETWWVQHVWAEFKAGIAEGGKILAWSMFCLCAFWAAWEILGAMGW